MKSFKDWVAKTAILSIDESEALAEIERRWPFGELIPVLVLSIVINLWRPSQGEVVLDEGEGAEFFVGHGQEFVNQRFNTLISKCVPALRAFRPERKDGEKPLPAVGQDQPILDQNGELVIAIRPKDHNGQPSPQPEKFPAWVLTHTGRRYWAPWAWLRRYGLTVELDWWGEVEYETRPEDDTDGEVGGTVIRKKHKVVKEVVFHPCLFNQAELDELRSILVASQVAEEHEVIRRKAISMREDGSVEFGLLPHGPQVTDNRDLYQEMHDSKEDDTRTALKAILEQQRTDTLPWLQHDYDGDDVSRRKTDVYALGEHPGYAGIEPLPRPSRDDNKEMARPRYRLGKPILLARKEEDGKLTMLREPNVLTLQDGTTWVPKDEPTRHMCIRDQESFERNGRTIRYTRYGDVFSYMARRRDGKLVHVSYVEGCYRNGLIKRVDRSHAIEIEGILRGIVESGDFKFVLIRRKGEETGTKVHKCHSRKCPRDAHPFSDKGYAHVCGVSDLEYWMVKAKVIVGKEHFPFLELPKEATHVVAEIYGSLVGELMRAAPQAFKKQVHAINILN